MSLPTTLRHICSSCRVPHQQVLTVGFISCCSEILLNWSPRQCNFLLIFNARCFPDHDFHRRTPFVWNGDWWREICLDSRYWKRTCYLLQSVNRWRNIFFVGRVTWCFDIMLSTLADRWMARRDHSCSFSSIFYHSHWVDFTFLMCIVA